MKRLLSYGVVFLILILTLVLSGCATTSYKAFATEESAVKLRSIQTRAFDTTDKKMMMQTVISTMQDLDFVIDKADFLLGSVTGSKFLGNEIVKMTVTIRPRGGKQLLVRVNAQYGIKTIEDPGTSQDFLFLWRKPCF